MAISYVVDGAETSCTMGVNKSTLKILPTRKVVLRGSKRANIGDSAPLINILPFGFCKATSPTKPCTPACSLWSGGKTGTLVDNHLALLSNSTLICTAGGGIISITKDGQ